MAGQTSRSDGPDPSRQHARQSRVRRALRALYTDGTDALANRTRTEDTTRRQVYEWENGRRYEVDGTEDPAWFTTGRARMVTEEPAAAPGRTRAAARNTAPARQTPPTRTRVSALPRAAVGAMEQDDSSDDDAEDFFLAAPRAKRPTARRPRALTLFSSSGSSSLPPSVQIANSPTELDSETEDNIVVASRRPVHSSNQSARPSESRSATTAADQNAEEERSELVDSDADMDLHNENQTAVEDTIDEADSNSQEQNGDDDSSDAGQTTDEDDRSVSPDSDEYEEWNGFSDEEAANDDASSVEASNAEPEAGDVQMTDVLEPELPQEPTPSDVLAEEDHVIEREASTNTGEHPSVPTPSARPHLEEPRHLNDLIPAGTAENALGIASSPSPPRREGVEDIPMDGTNYEPFDINEFFDFDAGAFDVGASRTADDNDNALAAPASWFPAPASACNEPLNPMNGHLPLVFQCQGAAHHPNSPFFSCENCQLELRRGLTDAQGQALYQHDFYPVCNTCMPLHRRLQSFHYCNCTIEHQHKCTGCIRSWIATLELAVGDLRDRDIGLGGKCMSCPEYLTGNEASYMCPVCGGFALE